MKVFISWSGEMSYQVAKVLRDWLPYVIQAVKPFVSTADIKKGARWNDVLAKELEDTDLGIICVTSYNVAAPWLNYESGALSKAVGRSLVLPFLFRVKDVQGPLAQFQLTGFDKEDVFHLLCSINSRLEPALQLEQERLRHTFDHWWDQLATDLDKISDVQNDETETRYSWMFTSNDLARIELSPDYKSVWVITPCPHQDLEISRVRDMLHQNVQRGVHYTFIMPCSEESAATKEKLLQIFADRLKQLDVKEIDDKTFRGLAVTHYLVLYPDESENAPTLVLLELPIEQHGYWIRVEEAAAFGLIARFRKMIDETPSAVCEEDRQV